MKILNSGFNSQASAAATGGTCAGGMAAAASVDVRFPGEFEPHEGTVLIWPVRPGSWTNEGREAQESFLLAARAIAEGEKVWILTAPETVSDVQARVETMDADAVVKKNIIVLPVETDDAWARDVGPTCVIESINAGSADAASSSDDEAGIAGVVKGIDWKFNAWGGDFDGLYEDYDKDNAAAKAICEALNLPVIDAEDFVLEGGSIHSDGEGTLLTTEACLLSGGRNPEMSKDQIEERLKKELGVKKVIWLPRGIWQDETNEHVDNVAAFVRPGVVILATTSDREDPQYELSQADLKVLEETTDAKGRKLEVIKLPIPDVPVRIKKEELEAMVFAPGEDVREEGERLAASYVNFYIANTCVVVPAFGGENEASDARAAEILQKAFPERKVVQIPARAIIVGGGNLHCVTQQIPLLKD